MSVIKCPRCDINFIKEEDGYCPICIKEMKGEMPKEDTIDFCIECGENPAVLGEELCQECLKAQQLALEAVVDDKASAEEDEEDSGKVDEEDIDVEDPLVVDIPENELEAIHHELGFDDEDGPDEDEFDGFYEEDIYDKILEQ